MSARHYIHPDQQDWAELPECLDSDHIFGVLSRLMFCQVMTEKQSEWLARQTGRTHDILYQIAQEVS
jgi:hypothetical protein